MSRAYDEQNVFQNWPHVLKHLTLTIALNSLNVFLKKYVRETY